MPLHCFENRRSPTELDVDDRTDDDEDDLDLSSVWQHAPDSILLHIFTFLDVYDLGVAAKTCQTWRRISLDESLWKTLLCDTLQHKVAQLPGSKTSWREEVKRIRYHAPVSLTETLTEHTDEVLHVSFSHNGKMFSTTSKDATLKVWEVGYPTSLKYNKDFRELLAWDFTQFSSFNESDTMVLVSSVKSTHLMDRRGYMAILSLIHDFAILQVVTMDPSQLFGAWLDDTTYLGGSLEISLDRFATTVQIEAHEVTEIFLPIQCPHPLPKVEETSGKPLFTFSSETASLIKFLTVASRVRESTPFDRQEEHVAVTGSVQESVNRAETVDIIGTDNERNSTGKSSAEKHFLEKYEEIRKKIARNDMLVPGDDQALANSRLSSSTVGSKSPPVGFLDVEDSMELGSEDTRSDQAVPCATSSAHHICDSCGQPVKSDDKRCGTCASSAGNSKRPGSLELANCDKIQTAVESAKHIEKNLILVTGEFAVALHQIGFKNVPPYTRESVLLNGATPMDSDNPEGYMVVNYSNNDIHIVHRQQLVDTPDHLIDLFGHVTGLCLTPDQRYLFINCRPWVGDIDRSDPWATPDLSPNIEVRIIDLCSLKDIGVRYKGHKGFSPPNMCCFVFLDVSPNYVASGSEDAKGYMWDRHYQVLLKTYDHEPGVVNAVGFCPGNEEYMVTVSDDKTIKVWRSRSEVKRLGILMENVDISEEAP